MPATSLTVLSQSPHQEKVAGELSQMAERIVREQSGLGGKVLQGAFAAGQKFDPDIANKASARLLPSLLENLNPMWASYQADGEPQGFGAYLNEHQPDSTNTLLSVLDDNAAKVDNQQVQKIYRSIRGRVEKVVQAHLTDLGELLESNMRQA